MDAKGAQMPSGGRQHPPPPSNQALAGHVVGLRAARRPLGYAGAVPFPPLLPPVADNFTTRQMVGRPRRPGRRSRDQAAKGADDFKKGG